MSWPCADMSEQTLDAHVPFGYPLYRCPTCGHHACMTGYPCETCATNRRIDQLIGDDR